MLSSITCNGAVLGSGEHLVLGRSPVIVRIKRVVAGIVCHPLVGVVIAFFFRDRIPYRGMRIHTTGEVVGDSAKASIFWGIYESAEARFIRRHLCTRRDVVELGASLGVISSLIARKLAPGYRLICVEANPGIIPLLRQNIAVNAPRAAVSVLGGAIDYELSAGDTAVLHVGGAHTTTRLLTPGDVTGSRLPTQAVHLRDLLRSMHIERYTLVADIEGAEAGLLMDDAESLSGCEQMIVELHATSWKGTPMSVEHMLGRLQGMGFCVTASRGPVFVLCRQ